MVKHYAILLLALFSLTSNAQSFNAAGERKVNAIDRVIHLNEMQKGIIKRAYEKLLVVQDSAMNKVLDTERSFQIIYDAKHDFHNRFIGILTTAQLVAYVKSVYKPEVNAKASYYCSLLTDTGKYDELTIKEYKKKISEYLMLEKIVYVRDKYDYAKQKNNISRLKALQPTCLKEALNLEKQKGLNKLRNGKIAW